MKYLLFISIYLSTNLYAIEDKIYNEILVNYIKSLSTESINKSTNYNIEKKEIIEKKTSKKINTYIIENSLQNLRIASSNNSQILHVLAKGTKVKLLKKIYKNNNLWLRVEYLNTKKLKVIGYLFQGNKY